MSAVIENRAMVRSFKIHDRLAPYLSGIYLNEIEVAPGARMVDMLHPKWANLRFVEGDRGAACIGPGNMRLTPSCVFAGPTSYATRLETGTSRSWGIGLQPLGWVKFFRTSADGYADKIIDAEHDPVFEPIVNLSRIIIQRSGDPRSKAKTISNHFIDLLRHSPPDDFTVVRAQEALADLDVKTVSEFAARAGISVRSLERLSRRVFGFAPNALLRRQRFLRTLDAMMHERSRCWSSSLDKRYYDQSQFTRDFKHFMGLTPTAFLAQPRPIIDAAVPGRRVAVDGHCRSFISLVHSP